jgi:hypothetical protein
MLSLLHPESLRQTEILFYHSILKDEYECRKIILNLLDVNESIEYLYDIMGNIDIILLNIPNTLEEFIDSMPKYDDLEKCFDLNKIKNDCIFRYYFKSNEKGGWMKKTIDLLRYKKYIRKDLKRLYSDIDKHKIIMNNTIMNVESLHNRMDMLYVSLSLNQNTNILNISDISDISNISDNICIELNNDLSVISNNVLNNMNNLLSIHKNIVEIES